MTLVVSLAEVADREARRVGPKAANLARLIRAGLPVPRGFCIAGEAYRQHIRRNGLAGRIEDAAGQAAAQVGGQTAAASPGGRAAILAGIRAAIAGSPLAPELAGEIDVHWRGLDGGAAAVRSSATAEDLPGQSFAGQHDTYLGVADLAACLARVKDCWASLWSDRAFEYRARNGIDHIGVDMAVIVQALVPAEAAGVMFTADPVSGRRDCAVIEASLGLGEAVVAGRVTPDHVIVSKRVFRVERRFTASKAIEVVPDPSGFARQQEVDPARAARPCVDDATAGRLALLGAKIEDLMGGPQDVEWAVAGDQVHVLQARPITVLPPAPRRSFEDRQIWMNINLREVVPDVMTPLTYTLIRWLGPLLFEAILRRCGIDVAPDEVGGLVAGRMYFNVNTLAAIGQELSISSRRDTAVMFGGGGRGARATAEVRIPEDDLPKLRVQRWRRLTRLPDLLWWVLRNPMRRGPGMLARFHARTSAMRDEPWRTLSDPDLARRILSAERMPREEILHDGSAIAVVTVGLGCSLIVMDLCRRWLGDECGDVAKRLLAGLGGLEDAEAGVALWKLAALAHGDAEVAPAIRQEEQFAGVVRRIEGTSGGRAFLAAWRQFMEAHGHHARGEMELGNPRWAERPDYVLGLLRSHLAGLGRVDPVAQGRRLARQRRDLARQSLRRLRNPIKRLILDAVLRRAQDGLRFRETIKSRIIRWLAILRQMLLELGGRLARRGIIEQGDDVFFLEVTEIIPAAEGSLDPRGIIARRRAKYDRNVALDPPAVVFGRFDPQRCPPAVVDERAGVLHGMGVSAGVASGKARIILHAGEGHVLPGEVLVAPFTDPGWTPYFLNAAAIVMDQGGQLSHGSIVAREYGIPCVTDVGAASRTIRTGQLVEVDGDRGVVRILDPHSA